MAQGLVLALMLVGCSAAQPAMPDDSGSSASSSPIRSSMATEPLMPPPIDESAHGGIYENNEYGFRLRYPTYYEPLASWLPEWKEYGMHIEDDTLVFEGSRPALLTVRSRNRAVRSEISMSVVVYPMQDYSYSDIYNDEYVYDPQAKTWMGRMQQEPFTPETRTIAGQTAYVFSFGDAGHSSRTFVIPQEEKGVMIELSVGGCPACAREEPILTDAEENAAFEKMASDTDTIAAGMELLP